MLHGASGDDSWTVLWPATDSGAIPKLAIEATAISELRARAIPTLASDSPRGDPWSKSCRHDKQNRKLPIRLVLQDGHSAAWLVPSAALNPGGA
jgi:hypothetical protein